MRGSHFVFRVTKANFIPGANDVSRPFPFDLRLLVKKGVFEGRGSIGNSATRFEFSGDLNYGRINLEKILLLNKQLYSQLWGQFTDQYFKLKGYALFKTDSTVPPPKSNPRPWLDKFKIRIVSLLSRDKIRPLEDPDFYVSDLETKVRFEFPTLDVDYLKFALNNSIISTQGKIHLEQAAHFDLTTDVISLAAKKTRKDELALSSRLTGKVENGRYQTDGYFVFYFEKKEDGRHAPDQLIITLNQLTGSLQNVTWKNIALDKVRFLFWANKNQHQLDIQNIKARLNWQPNRWKFMDFTAHAEEGQLAGTMWLDVKQNPVRMVSIMNLINAQTQSLKDFLVHFERIDSRIDGRFKIENQPEWHVDGQFQMTDGRINDLQFFKWMADTFVLPSLHRVAFEECHSQFHYSAQQTGLENLHLKTKTMALEGHYKVDDQSLVSSKLSMLMTRGLLNESPKLKRIMALFEKDVDSLTFDFQLSGLQSRMNFQWLQSEFKQRIQDRIPNFIERRIEQAIDIMLQPEPVPSPEPVVPAGPAPAAQP
jgi:hypothetical protein